MVHRPQQGTPISSAAVQVYSSTMGEQILTEPLKETVIIEQMSVNLKVFCQALLNCCPPTVKGDSPTQPIFKDPLWEF